MINRNSQFEFNEKDRSIRLLSQPDFIPSQIFENGQCFRWDKTEDECYTGVAMGRALTVTKTGNDILFQNCSPEEFTNIWYGYFDLDTDYGKIKERMQDDAFARQAAAYAPGLRILRQEYFETLVSFILSQNNNIPRIKKIVGSLCIEYGNQIDAGGKPFNAFPGKEAIIGLDEAALGFCRAGYRCGYLAALSDTRIPAEGLLRKLSLDEQRSLLCGIKGVGPKVADCILLFTGLNRGAFPVDTWVRRVVRDIYGIEGNNKKIQEFAGSRFGQDAGVIQQYLFYYAREMKL